MKIKVDKNEYEHLLERVAYLERDKYHTTSFEREITIRLYDAMDDYFKQKAQVILIKRDKEEIIGEIRKRALDNIFREEYGGEE